MSTVRSWSDEGLAWVEIHRPEKLNALNRETLRELCDVLQRVRRDPEARVILLTGAGERAFSAGADIAEMAAEDAEGVRALMELGKEAALLLEEAPQPCLAVVNGYALGGGCELVLACDMAFAGENAQLALPEVDLGVLPGWGGTQRLERWVGYGRAREMIFTGRRVPAAEAHAWGLCERVVPLADLRSEAAAVARVMAAKDPGALRAAKVALRRGAVLPPQDALRHETDLFVELFDRPERAAAMSRFLRRE